jgi:hypothetical protein
MPLEPSAFRGLCPQEAHPGGHHHNLAHAAVLYAQYEPCYGQLVRVFLGQQLRGNAVKITCVRAGQN